MPHPLLPRLDERRIRLVAAAVAAVVVVMAVACVGVLAAVDRGAFDGPIARTASKALGRPVRFDTLNAHLLSGSPRLTVTGLKVGNPAWAGPGDTLQARRVELAFRWSRVLTGDLRPAAIAVDEPVAHLIRASRTQKNWSSGKGGGGGKGLSSTRTLRIGGGRFTYDDRVRGMTLAGVADYDEKRGAEPLHASAAGILKGGGISLALQGGPLTGRKPRAPYPFRARVQDGATILAARGTSIAPLSFRGFDLDVEASGPNLANMKYLIGVGLPNSAPYRLSAHLAREGRTTRATNLRATVGASDFTGSIVSDGSKRRRMLRIDLRSKVLHAADIGHFLAHRPEHARTRSVSGAVHGGGGGRLLSDKPIDLTRFRSRDARLQIVADRFVIGDMAPGRLTTTGVLDHGVFTLKPFSLAFGSGRADGSLGMDLRNAKPAFRLDGVARGPLATLVPSTAEAINGAATLTVHLAGAGGSFRAVGLGAQGTARLSVRNGDIQKSKAKVLSGAVISGALASLTNKDARTALPCAVADLVVGGGRVRGRRILLVTGAGTAMGVGQIDLASETIDMTVYGRPTGLRLFTVDKPVALRGPMLSPKVDVLPKGGSGAPAPEVPKADEAARLCAAAG